MKSFIGSRPQREEHRSVGRVRRRLAHRVTLIPGDGTGPELAEATRRVLEATGVGFDWDVQQAGTDVMEQNEGNPLPEHVLESIRRNGTALKGPITTPVGGGFRSVNVGLRKALDLYGPGPPLQELPGRPLRYANVDLIVVRENTEDLYAGVEFEDGTEAAPTSCSTGSPPRATARSGATPASRSSRSPRPAPARSSSSPSTTPAATAGARSRRCTRRTS